MSIDWLGAALAFVAGMGVAYLWYSDYLFNRRWLQLVGLTPDQAKGAQPRTLPQLAIANAVTALGLAIAVAVTTAATGAHGVTSGLAVAAVTGPTFSVTTLVQHNAFEQKPAPLTLLNAGYQLALFLVMGLVIGLV